MKIIAGLGNPGRKYEGTRHNVGYAALDKTAERCEIRVNEGRFQGLTGRGFAGGEKVMLVKPLTFMNLSGQCIGQVCRYFQVDPEKDLIVLYDDVSLEPGKIRIRAKGSAGGHNGVKSIITALGTQNFLRVKIGVGEKPLGMDLADYVLSRLHGDDAVAVLQAVDRASRAAIALLVEEPEKVMNMYNG